jgi:tetratricopeptide (TPR) repeat protein
MAKPLQPRPGRQRRAAAPTTPSLPKAVLDEIRRTTKPTSADDAIARLDRAGGLLERGDASGAAREAAKAKAMAPRSGAVREVLGLALYGDERWQEALSEMKAYRRLSGRPDQNHIIADCLRAVGRASEVVPLAEEALRARIPNEVKAEVVIVAASALADQRRFPEALAFLRRAQTRDDVAEGYTLRLWYVAGDILQRAGRGQEAEREFRKVFRHDPGAFDVAERLAQLG